MHSFHKRRHPRRAVGSKGCVYAGKDAIPCVIVDMSHQGARLQLAVNHALPPRFSLLVSAAEPLLECELVWQTEATAGLRII